MKFDFSKFMKDIVLGIMGLIVAIILIIGGVILILDDDKIGIVLFVISGIIIILSIIQIIAQIKNKKEALE